LIDGRSWAADSDATLKAALREAVAGDRPARVEVRVRG
jgi:hypothetical protein